MKILIIEDDPNIVSILSRGFAEEHHIVDSATDGEEGEYLAQINHYDVIVLDWMLPSKSGIDILKTVREDNITTPIIMLSAKGEVEDRVLGLRRGADDYLPKPFSFEELLVRVEALHRRDISQGVNEISINNMHINLDSKEISIDLMLR
ncbi:MAG TPA: response regulator transcription factor [Campylobacterales bacterium]|nr:response regulator transcription factor [Campylobacterales bacterium]